MSVSLKWNIQMFKIDRCEADGEPDLSQWCLRFHWVSTAKDVVR